MPHGLLRVVTLPTVCKEENKITAVCYIHHPNFSGLVQAKRVALANWTLPSTPQNNETNNLLELYKKYIWYMYMTVVFLSIL